MPTVLPMTRVEAYLAYKAGVISESDLKPSLKTNYYSGLEHWLAYWCGLCNDYPTKDGQPKWYTEEEYYVAYLCGIAPDYPVNCYRRVGAYLRYIISSRWDRPEKPLTREEYYLSLISTTYLPPNDPASIITLDNTAEGPFKDLKIYGDTKQTTLSGKNLLLYPYYDTPNSPVTRFDVTWTDMGDGTVKANGTPSGTSQFIFFTSQAGLPIQPNTTYTLSGGDKTKGVVFSLDERDAGGTVIATHDNVETLTFTTNANAHTLTGGLKRYSNSITIDNFICKPQLELGSPATSWEQYCGGTASPNPSYPQQIDTVTGEQTVSVTGKNLFDISKVVSRESRLINNNDGTLIVLTSATSTYSTGSSPNTLADYCPTLRVGDVATLNMTSTGSSTNYIGLSIDNVVWYFGTSKTITQDMLDSSVRFYASGTNSTATISNIQLELGSTATAYQPYQSQTYKVNLGKNLWGGYTTYSRTSNDVLFSTNSDGTITASGTASADAYSITGSLANTNSVLAKLPAGVYSLSTDSNLPAGVVLQVIDVPDGTAIKEGAGSFTLSADTKVAVRIKVANGTVLTDGITVKPMLEVGSTATTYSAYFTPIELCKIGEYQDVIYRNVQTSGKNLWGGFSADFTKALSGITFKTKTDGTFTAQGSASANTWSATLSDASSNGLFVTLEAGTYTKSTKDALPTGVYLQVFNLDTSTEISGTSFTLTEETKVAIRLYVSNGTDLTSGITVCPQLEIGPLTPYEPYQNPYYDSDLPEGAWCIHKAIHKILLKGTENWLLGSMFYCTDAIPGTKYAIAPTNGNIKSDYFTYFAGAGAGLDPSIDIANGYVLRIRYSAKADVSALTTWLSTHNTTVYYALATPTNTAITDATLISQLNALLEGGSYAPQTNITLTTAEPNLPGLLQVTAAKWQ